MTSTTTTNPTHLLRALLRACSYLPDGPSRHYFHEHILHRFRHVTTPTLGAYRARKALSLLTRATNGDVPALTKVLHHTYGRAGHRRHTLLNALLSEHNIHSDAEAPTAISPAVRQILKPPTEVANLGGIPVPAKPHDAPPTSFERLLADQILRYPASSPRTQLKKAYAPIPLENVFLRPTGPKREEGLRKRWLAETMDKILPPLPEEEWNRLRGLATGVVEWEGAPKRRTPVGKVAKEADGGLLSVEYLKAPISHAHSKVRKSEIDQRNWHERTPVGKVAKEADGGLLSVEYLKTPISHAHSKVRKSDIDQRNWHRLTPKYMQRMYAKIWELCPKSRWDEELRDWVYTWGGTKIAANRAEPKKVAQRDLSLFEGIEDLGKTHVRARKRVAARGKVIPEDDINVRESSPSND
ncbi:hypothetical protein V498_05442 [Pseudogymnoascus sp. VKM F-4517 (FW-2822)]|nr:hypothetical protein V498_05442 [Pseudogymnoascus sp. VKM F-4517 (FW-2822)]